MKRTKYRKTTDTTSRSFFSLDGKTVAIYILFLIAFVVVEMYKIPYLGTGLVVLAIMIRLALTYFFPRQR